MTARVESLTRSLRDLPAVVGPLLLAAAIIGFMVGYRHAPAPTSASSSAAISTVSTAGVVLEHPADWQAAQTAPAIPGLTLAHQLALALGADARQAGLLTGELPTGEAAPLPSAFLTALHGNPRTEVLNLPGGQAYRYSRISLEGYSSTLELFVIPGAGEGSAALACYATRALALELKQCEQIVASLALENQGQGQDDLNPDSAYAGGLAALVGTLDRERVKLRTELHAPGAPARAGSVADQLAARFDAAGNALSRLEAPLAAHAAATTLADALRSAHDGYRALAVAAGAEAAGAYDVARERVDQAEASVDTALQGFALIGYGGG